MKSRFLKGTLILTAAGLLSRLIGFAYKIFLAKAMTEEDMGLYQLVFPVFSICFTLFASGIQSALSKQIAEYSGNEKKQKILFLQALATSLSIAVILMMITSNFSDFIASKLIGEAKLSDGIRILSCSFPFCSVNSCINGFFYGKKKSAVPALSQLVEQITRVCFVYLFSFFTTEGLTAGCELAVAGITVGETAACIFNILGMSRIHFCHDNCNISNAGIYRHFSAMYLPLTINRLILSMLRSFETILLPVLLVRYGMEKSSALSVLGVLNGMTIPFLVFPSAITGAISILLLPTISEADSKGNHTCCLRLTNEVLKYSLVLGFYCLGIFTICGREICLLLFGSLRSGTYLYILSFLCPLMYMSSSVPSILNGIGKPLITFRNSCITDILQIIMLTFGIIHWGLTGYFIVMYVMQIIQGAIDLYSLNHENLLSLNCTDAVIKPGLTVALCIPAITFILKTFTINGYAFILLSLGIFLFIYTLLLIITGVIKIHDFI